MKFKEFIEQINKFAEENPETLEMDVITASDPEGNSFDKIHFPPSKGYFSDQCFDTRDDDINAVCVN